MTHKRLPIFLISLLKPMMLLGGRHWWLSVVFWILWVAPALALELRVAIHQGKSQLQVGSSTKALVRDAAGQEVGELAALNGYKADSKQGNVALGQWRSQTLWIEPTDGGYTWIGDRWYRG